MQHRRDRIMLHASVLFALAAAAWIGAGTSSAQKQQAENVTVPPFIAANDVQFIDALVPHHEMAIRMADIELQKGTRAEVKAMAQMMKDAQA